MMLVSQVRLIITLFKNVISRKKIRAHYWMHILKYVTFTTEKIILSGRLPVSMHLVLSKVLEVTSISPMDKYNLQWKITKY